jgi:hypothetical protein
MTHAMSDSLLRTLPDPVKSAQQGRVLLVYWWRIPQERPMTITIDLPPGKLEELKAEAAATGKDVETVVRDAVDARLARRKQTFADVLKPIHDAVEASGITEEEAIGLLDKALKDVRGARSCGQAQS